MKNVTKVVLLLGGMTASALAFAFDSSAVQHELQKQINELIVSSGEVSATVSDDGMVTLSGYADGSDAYRIVDLAKHKEGVTDVTNLITED